jgi:single-strand DNA-binding protein
MSLCKVTIIGRLGGDPELRDVGGQQVARLNVAVNERYKGEERTQWFNVSVWGKQATACAEYLSKGREVYCEGRFQARTYEDKSGKTRVSLDVNATDVKFIGGKAEAAEKPPVDVSFPPDDDSDLPF